MNDNLEDALRRSLVRKAASIDPASLRPAGAAELPVGLSAGERTVSRQRRLMTAAAMLLVVAAIAGVVTWNSGSPRTPVAAGPPAAPPPAPRELRIWPLNGDEPLPPPSDDDPRTPDLVARQYLTEVLALPPDWPIQEPASQDATSVVDFILQDVPSQLQLLRDESGSWFVTGASSDRMRPTLAATRPSGVEISLAAGPRTPEFGVDVRLTAIAADGTRLAATEGRIDPAPAEIPVTLQWAEPELAAVVRVDALDDHDADPTTPELVVGHWSTAVDGPPAGTLPPSCDADRGEAVFRRDGTPDHVALEYLKDRFPDYPSPGVETTHARTRGSRAFVGWSVEGDIAYGTIFLRQTAGAWAVIASTTNAVDLSRIHVDAERVRGTITTTNDNALFADVLRADGSPVAGAPRPEGHPGAAYRFATASGPGSGSITLDVPLDGEAPTIRAGLVGGTILSIAECRPSAAP